MILGITQLNKIITETERIGLLDIINNALLSDEQDGIFYKNSFGSQIKADAIFDRLTEYVSQLTGYKISKQVIYARKYLSGGTLKPHKDRDGLDLTLSIQLNNTFSKDIPIYAKGYDGTIFQSDLKNGDAVLIKGRDLEHWRDDIILKEDGVLTCVFFHWQIDGLEFVEIDNFLDAETCKQIISDNKKNLKKVNVLESNKITYSETRTGKNTGIIDKYSILEKLKPYIFNLKSEGFQLLEYKKGNKFIAHQDNGNGINNRLFTVIIYLNENYIGGETEFLVNNSKIIPKTGKCVIWKNLNNGELNNYALHAGKEVINGTKYVLVNWILNTNN